MRNAENYVIFIGKYSDLTAAEFSQINACSDTCFLLLTSETLTLQKPDSLNVCTVKSDPVPALLPFYQNMMGAELETKVLDPSCGWSVQLQQELPNVLEQLGYMQMRLSYAPFVENALLNVNELMHPIIAYSDWCEGKTAVVLGAAPSLETFLPWVKHHRKQLVIFAVARLAKRLLAEGLAPDFFVASDPTEATLTHAESLEQFQSQSVLIVQHYATPTLLEIWKGGVLYWGPDWPQNSKDYKTEENVEIEGGTVANLAILSALGMGCKTVYSAGMDFCFDESGKTHETTSLEAEMAGHIETKHETLENYQGKTCLTTTEFLNAVQVLPDQLRVLEQRYGLSKDYQVYNLNPNAAKINGIEVAETSSIQLTDESSPDIKVLVDRLKMPEIDRRKKLHNTLKILQRQQKHYRELRQLAQKGVRLFETVSEEAMTLQSEAFEFIQKCQRLHKKLEKNIGQEDKFIQRFGFQYFTELIQVSNQLQMSPNEMKLQYRYFQTSFSAYSQTASGLVKVYENAMNKTRFLMEELKCLHQFDSLSALWISEGRPYRFLGWQQQFAQLAEQARNENKDTYQQLMDALKEWQSQKRILSKNTFAYLSQHPHKIKYG